MSTETETAHKPEYTREEMREACRNNYNAGQAVAAAEIERLTRDLAQQRRVNEIGLSNLRDARSAMLLIREAVETLAPVGAVRCAEYIGPTPHEEAMAIIDGIQAIHDVTQRKLQAA